jgi:hypothetical protein
VSAESRPTTVDLDSGAESRLRLSVRTSMRNEFRDASGALGLFELSRHFATVGAICTALARIPGIQFEETGKSLWSTGAARFSFYGCQFQISAPFQDVRIGPVEAGAIYPETEELLRLVSEHLFPKWQSRARTRFYRV